MLRSRAIALVLSLAAAPALAQHEQQLLRIEWSKNVTEFRGQDGRLVTLVCPPDGQASDVWGTDRYTDDSSVCSAAVHAGRVTLRNGGAVTIVIGPADKEYVASTRNGVTSRAFGSFAGSFSFAGRGAEGVVDWATMATGLDVGGGPLTLVCPPGGTLRTVWGTDVYTHDSSICVAAVHAGVITLASGGRVTVENRGPQAEFKSSVRGGVSTQGWSAEPRGFSVAAAGASVVTASARPTVDAAATSATTASMVTTAPIARTATTATTATTAKAPMRTAVTTTSTATDATPTPTATNAPMGAIKATVGTLPRLITTPTLELTGRYMPDRAIITPRLTLTGTAPQ
jgi:LCCL domain